MISWGSELKLHHKKNCLWGLDQVQHKPGCTATEDGQRLQILEVEELY